MNHEYLHQDLPDYLPAEIGDRVQFFLRSNADQQMRFVIYLSQHINFERLKKALRYTIFAEPIFSYFYCEDMNEAFWQKQKEIDTSLLIDLLEVNSDLESQINDFLTLEISPFGFPIVKMRVIRNGFKDTICINMNHTPTDGSGLKEFVKILASIYTNLVSNPDFIVKPNIQGDRSLKQVANSFTFFQKMEFLKQGFKSPKRIPSWSFDWDKSDADNQKHFVSTSISPNIFEKIKAYGKLNQATINDVILAAFIRVFFSTSDNNKNAAKPIIVPVDLRKYVNPTNHSAICSLTGSLICNIGSDIGKNFNDTLVKVMEEMTYKKKVHAEMNMLSTVILLSKLMPYTKLKEQLMNRRMPPIPLVTNVGIINSSDLNFDGITVEHSYITGAISYGNYFCLGYSTFEKETTFSIGFTGGEIQKQKAMRFLSVFKSELENINCEHS
jgi:NRPS condensation-like uncharacterized protein